jgi:hypothetical protein
MNSKLGQYGLPDGTPKGPRQLNSAMTAEILLLVESLMCEAVFHIYGACSCHFQKKYGASIFFWASNQ